MNTNSNKKLLLFSTLFLVGSVLVFSFVYYLIKKNMKLTEVSENEWREEIFQRENINSLNNSVQSLQKERESLNKHFVQGAEIVPFLDTLEKLARQAGAEAEVTSVDLENKINLVVELKAEGSFESIYKLISLLENSDYQLEFILASLNKVENEKTWVGNFKMKLLTFLPQ